MSRCAPTAKVVFSDLDGTLLDERTYSIEAALPALELLERLRVPLVFCTSKTRAEVEDLRRQLRNRHPFIVENGGAAFVPRGYFGTFWSGAETGGPYHVIELGDPHACLTAALDRASEESRCRVLSFHEMSVEEIAASCGLDPLQAARAMQREYDEPFQVLDASRGHRLLRAIERLGKRWTRGDAWYHITGCNDKAGAARKLIALYRRACGRVLAIGLGDGLNDAPLLRATRISYAVRSRFTAALLKLAPHARVTNAAGPAGWNETILDLFSADEPPPSTAGLGHGHCPPDTEPIPQQQRHGEDHRNLRVQLPNMRAS